MVQDTTPPEITCPATIVAECQGNRHATVVPGDATATDICAGVVVTDPPSASFPLGSSFVTHSAKDAVGLTDSCNAEIKVVDTTRRPSPARPRSRGSPTISPAA